MSDYIRELIANCGRALEASPERELVLQNLADLDGIERAIYTIELIAGDETQVFLDFVEHRARRERASAKVNAPSKTLYVGSSTTDVKARIRQHLGDGHKATSALHLKHWCDPIYQVCVLVYPDLPRPVIQILEDSMAYKLKPPSARRGRTSAAEARFDRRHSSVQPFPPSLQAPPEGFLVRRHSCPCLPWVASSQLVRHRPIAALVPRSPS